MLSSAIATVGGVRLAWQRPVVLVAALVVFAGLEWFVTRTKLGKAMRAMSQNREACAVVGVDVQRVALATFGLSAALAGAAAALVSPLFNIFPDVGALLTLKAFAAVIVGGFGYVKGAIAAAFLIGIAESLAAGYLSYAYKDAIAFVVMVAVLLVPQAALMFTPGAKRSTQVPKLEKLARASVISLAATVSAAGARAGD